MCDHGSRITTCGQFGIHETDESMTKGCLIWCFLLKLQGKIFPLLTFLGSRGVLPGHGWRPPELECVKINIDGAINVVDSNGGARGITRSVSRLVGA
jgi:hypothetical protein